MADQLPMVLVDAEPFVMVVQTRQAAAIVVAEGRQGPPGRPGIGGAQISAEPNNRIIQKPDGLYVSDGFEPDPLAHYILAKG